MRQAASSGLTRRRLIAGGALALIVRPALASPEQMKQAVEAFTGDRQATPGRVKLDIPYLVENGNSVSMSVTVESPMTAADHVKRIAVFNEKNPQPDIAIYHLGPRCGRAQVATRIRLADSQTLTAIAEMSDGSLWSTTAEVIVTLAACLEG